MLERPEIGSKPHIKLWVGSKDPKEKFDWSKQVDCACGQYSREHYGADYDWLNTPDIIPALRELNRIAQFCGGCGLSEGRTFGALYTDLCNEGW